MMDSVVVIPDHSTQSVVCATRETMCCLLRLVDGSSIMRQVGTRGSLVNMECVLHSWVNESFPRQECWGSAIPTDTWSHRSL